MKLLLVSLALSIFTGEWRDSIRWRKIRKHHLVLPEEPTPANKALGSLISYSLIFPASLWLFIGVNKKDLNCTTLDFAPDLIVTQFLEASRSWVPSTFAGMFGTVWSCYIFPKEVGPLALNEGWKRIPDLCWLRLR